MNEIGKEKVVDPETGKELIEPSFNPIYIMADSGAAARPSRFASSPPCAA